jgi:hypothetical protein
MRSTVTGRRHRRQPVSEELIHGARRAEGMTAAVQNASVHPYLVMLPAQRSRKETAQPTHPDPRQPVTQRPVNRSSACVSVAHTASPSHIICRARAEVRLRYRA